MVWSADFPADDWTKISPAQVYSRARSSEHRGQSQRRPAAATSSRAPSEALPYLLKELKRRGYRIVHVVPATPELAKTATEARQWTVHAPDASTGPPFFIEAEGEPELPAPSPLSFGSRQHVRFSLGDARTEASARPHGAGARPYAAAAGFDVAARRGRCRTCQRCGSSAVASAEPAASPPCRVPPRAAFRRRRSTWCAPATGSADDIRPALESLPPEDAPTGTAPQVRGPVAIINMPRGAYP